MMKRRQAVAWLLMLVIMGRARAAAEEGSTSKAQEPVTLGAQMSRSSAETAPPISILASDDPVTHMTFATILFYRAKRLMQSGDPVAATVVFKMIETELLAALELPGLDKDPDSLNLGRSQSAFLLGDLALHVQKDPERARAYYQQALQFFPNHDGASQALQFIERRSGQPPSGKDGASEVGGQQSDHK
jgi:hypothetical protein